MSETAVDQIAEGLEKGVAGACSEAVPAPLDGPEIDVKAIRVGLKLTQRDFASTFWFGLDQLKHWEQRRSQPPGAYRAYLLLIKSKPELVIQMLSELRPAQGAPQQAERSMVAASAGADEAPGAQRR